MADKDNIFKRIAERGKLQSRVDNGIDPFEYHDPEKPISFDPFILIDKNNVNGEDNFVILRTTENGKYVRSGMLHFEFNGVDITTEINNAIFIDRLNNAIFIKNYDRVIEEITPVDPNERQYIIMYTSKEDGDETHLWEAMQGRITAYEWIRDNIDEKFIDPDNSYVLVETVPYKDALTVTAFIEYLKNSEMVPNDGFDIQEYIY